MFAVMHLVDLILLFVALLACNDFMMWTGDIIGNGRRNPVKSRGTSSQRLILAELLHHVHCAFAASLKLSIGISFTFVTTCIVCCRWIFLQNFATHFLPLSTKGFKRRQSRWLGGLHECWTCWNFYGSFGNSVKSFLAPILGQVRWLRLQLIEYAHNAFVNDFDYFDIPEIKFFVATFEIFSTGKIIWIFLPISFRILINVPWLIPLTPSHLEYDSDSGLSVLGLQRCLPSSDRWLPAVTRRHNNVIITSKRHRHVVLAQ